MANTKQTPPGLNAGNVYMRAAASLGEVLQQSMSSFDDPRMAGIEQADDWLSRDIESGISPSVAFNKGGLLQRKGKPETSRPAPQLRAEQEAFLDIARRRRELRESKGKS